MTALATQPSAPASHSVREKDDFKRQLLATIPSLRSFARGLCGDRETADDMAQEAMAKAWAARESFAPGTNFRAWIFMILRNHFYSTMRRDTRMVSWEPEAFEGLLHSPPDQEDKINVADVIKAMQALPSEQREVLILVGANGLSYEEASEIIGCPVGTVKSRLSRGREGLTAIIDGSPQTS